MDEGRTVFAGKTAKGLDVMLRYPMQQDVQALWEFINTLSQEQTFILFQGKTISIEDEQDYLAQTLDQIQNRRTVMILAFSDGRLIGNTDVTLMDGVSSHVGELGIAVAQPYRGQGVGELLMQTVCAEAEARLPGLEMVTLWVFGNNQVGISLYRKMGFVECGRLPGAVLHRGQFVDKILMYKAIHG